MTLALGGEFEKKEENTNMFGDYENHKERLDGEKLPLTNASAVTGTEDHNVKGGIVALKGYKALNIRKMPSLNSAILGTLHDGDAVTIYETESTGTFYKIRTADGIDGYSLREQIKMEK